VPLVVATANVQFSLARSDARATVAAVVAHSPDLVGLQEWHPWAASRWGLLRSFDAYAWFAPWLGGCAVGVRRDRLEVTSRRGAWLSRPGRADRSGRFLGLEPPRRASVVTCDDLSFVVYHLASQVQGDDDSYRSDRPRLAGRHRQEAAALQSLVAGLGSPTYACGDSNFHGFRLPGLASAWDAEGRTSGTHGVRRQIDDIHGPVTPADVVTVPTPSDHLAVVAIYE
jgi:hypothetical protein